MKINWFSPLPPARTDIAHYTARVLPALAETAEPIIWTDQSTWDAALTKLAPVRRFRPGKIPWTEINRADITFYQIGNNPLFHGSIWQLSRQHAGVVVLHDPRLHHLFDGIYRVNRRDRKGYLQLMEQYYGPEGHRDADESFRNQGRNILAMAERYPLTEFALENALAVVVHTQESYELLTAAGRWSVAYAPLPFDSSSFGGAEGVRRSDGPPYRLIVCGYIGRSRRVESILEALAAMPERELFTLDIYGEILQDEEKLRALVRSLGLKAQVTLHGFVAEAALDQALGESHLAINLRYPTMGEASGSQLRIWSHGLPSLVSPVGWYATLPKDTVAFVRPEENEVADLQSHWRALMNDQAKFAAMGRRGKELVAREHSPAQYAKVLVEIAGRATAARARLSTLKLADRAAMRLVPWLDQGRSASAVERFAEAIGSLAGARPAPKAGSDLNIIF